MRTQLYCLLLLCTTTFVQAQTDGYLQQKKFAIRILEHMNAGDFDSIVIHFDSTMKRKVNATFLDRSYGMMQQQFGEFKSYQEPRVTPQDTFTSVVVPVQFTKYDLELSVSTNNFTGQIAGLFIRPVKFTKEYVSPEYANNLCVGEKNLPLEGNGPSLPGRLSLPCRGEKFPVVILVHGSGPNDMDATVGPNKPFKDLVYQLAANGIATYRYDKRTKAAPETLGPDSLITAQEEVINDVHAAIRMIAALEFIDRSEIYVLGLSLGAMLAPRIANTSPLPLAGIIMMAAAGRPLEDVVLSQYEYISRVDGIVSAEEQAAIDKVAEQVKNVKKLKKNVYVNRANLPLNIPSAYWQDLSANPILTSLKKVSIPTLILHGERDYQVTMEDFTILKKATKKKSSIQSQSFAGLNHLFLPGKGPSKPTEYEEAGHVPQEVGEVISEFINKKN